MRKIVNKKEILQQLNQLKKHTFDELLNLAGRAYILVKYSENVKVGSRGFLPEEKENPLCHDCYREQKEQQRLTAEQTQADATGDSQATESTSSESQLPANETNETERDTNAETASQALTASQNADGDDEE